MQRLQARGKLWGVYFMKCARCLGRLAPYPVTLNGAVLEMGSEIDDPSPRALPSHYDHRSTFEAAKYAENRELLKRVMEGAGFHRLTHEWWHFSYGDQLWALVESLRSTELIPALYGEFRG
jgi:D-alanyl-D-alanine dipeptidase